MTVRNIAQAINDALDLALGKDEAVVVFGQDVGRTGGVFRVTDGLREQYGAERVIDSPVA
ncbi:MAG: alpha-ketoacid dehydrogenase subunit beta, partial [Actinobacteria bacterium]|nr:alpha-ketoacid dehydrogenase subunit beta [Actinomycetota bacterium]